MTRTFPSELGALAPHAQPLQDRAGGGQELARLAVSVLVLPLSNTQDLLIGTTELLSENLLPDGVPADVEVAPLLPEEVLVSPPVGRPDQDHWKEVGPGRAVTEDPDQGVLDPSQGRGRQGRHSPLRPRRVVQDHGSRYLRPLQLLQYEVFLMGKIIHNSQCSNQTDFNKNPALGAGQVDEQDVPGEVGVVVDVAAGLHRSEQILYSKGFISRHLVTLSLPGLFSILENEETAPMMTRPTSLGFSLFLEIMKT